MREAGWVELVPLPVEVIHDVTVRVGGDEYALDGSAFPERWQSSDGLLEMLLVEERHSCSAAGTDGMSFSGDVHVHHVRRTGEQLGGIARVTVYVDYTSFEGRRTQWDHSAEVATVYPMVLTGNGVRVVVERRPN